VTKAIFRDTHYLKWAYCEAGNSTAVNHKRFPLRHTSKPYKRIRERKGHAKAVGAVGRHLAEASLWVFGGKSEFRAKSKGSIFTEGQHEHHTVMQARSDGVIKKLVRTAGRNAVIQLINDNGLLII
jgi:hypothetical protein